MKFHNELNQKLFNKTELKPKVKDKLKEIADAFIKYLDINEDAIKDVVITGSSVSYNYTKYSDIDLHLKINYDLVHEDCPLVEGYLWSFKSQFNKDHDISIYGIPVEVYAESVDSDTVHNGLYSLRQNKWIDFPKKIPPTDNDEAVMAKFNEIKEAADRVKDAEVAGELINKIYQMRKAGLQDVGEFSTENLAFKKLRNAGVLELLKKIKKEKIDKELSLESYNKLGENKMGEKKSCLKSRTELDEIRKARAAKKLEVNEISYKTVRKVARKRASEADKAFDKANELGAEIVDAQNRGDLDKEKKARAEYDKFNTEVVNPASKKRNRNYKLVTARAKRKGHNGDELAPYAYYARMTHKANVKESFTANEALELSKKYLGEISDETADTLLNKRVQTAAAKDYDEESAEKEKRTVRALIRRKARQGKLLDANEKEFLAKNEAAKLTTDDLDNADLVLLKDGREGHIGGLIFDANDQWTGKWEFYTDENDYEYEEIETDDVEKVLAKKEVSESTPYIKKITKKEWDETPADYKMIKNGEKYLMYVDDDTHKTVLGKAEIVNEKP